MGVEKRAARPQSGAKRQKEEWKHYIVSDGRMQPTDVRRDGSWILPKDNKSSLPKAFVVGEVVLIPEGETPKLPDGTVVAEKLLGGRKTGVRVYFKEGIPKAPYEMEPEAGTLDGFEQGVRNKIIAHYKRMHGGIEDEEDSAVLEVLRRDRRQELLNGVRDELSETDKAILKGILVPLQMRRPRGTQETFLADLKTALSSEGAEPEVLGGFERGMLSELFEAYKGECNPPSSVGERPLGRLLMQKTMEGVEGGINELSDPDRWRVRLLIEDVFGGRELKHPREIHLMAVLLENLSRPGEVPIPGRLADDNPPEPVLLRSEPDKPDKQKPEDKSVADARRRNRPPADATERIVGDIRSVLRRRGKDISGTLKPEDIMNVEDPLTDDDAEIVKEIPRLFMHGLKGVPNYPRHKEWAVELERVLQQHSRSALVDGVRALREEDKIPETAADALANAIQERMSLDNPPLTDPDPRLLSARQFTLLRHIAGALEGDEDRELNGRYLTSLRERVDGKIAEAGGDSPEYTGLLSKFRKALDAGDEDEIMRRLDDSGFITLQVTDLQGVTYGVENEVDGRRPLTGFSQEDAESLGTYRPIDLAQRLNAALHRLGIGQKCAD